MARWSGRRWEPPSEIRAASSKSDPITDTDPTLSLLAYLCDNPNNVDLWRRTDLLRAAQGPVHRHRYEKNSAETNSTLTLQLDLRFVLPFCGKDEGGSVGDVNERSYRVVERRTDLRPMICSWCYLSGTMRFEWVRIYFEYGKAGGVHPTDRRIVIIMRRPPLPHEAERGFGKFIGIVASDARSSTGSFGLSREESSLSRHI